MNDSDDTVELFTREQLDAAVAAEREEIAKMADREAETLGRWAEQNSKNHAAVSICRGRQLTALKFAAAIRAREPTKPPST